MSPASPASASPRPSLRDPALPAVEALLGPDGAEVLAPAVAQGGGVIRVLTPRLINYSPGSAIRVRYDATVEYGDHTRHEALAAYATRDATVDDGVAASAANGAAVGVWESSRDPRLPGLRLALDESFVLELLEEVGIGARQVLLTMRSYSPRSRAVVEVAAPADRKLVVTPGRTVGWARPRVLLYLKVGRPERVRRLLRTHELLEDRLPIARCVGSREDVGLVAFAPLDGETLWDAVRRGAPVPGADELLELLEGLETVDLGPSSRPGARRSAGRDGEMLKVICPERADRVDRLLAVLGSDPATETVTVHGDFHEVQLLASEGRVTGLLDMDDAGRGQRLDDLAMMLGRLWCFARTEPDPAGRVAAYCDTLLDGFGRHVDRQELELRMAAVALCHATGPFRFQLRGWPQLTRDAINRADELLASARRA